jgi:hypothetical protein
MVSVSDSLQATLSSSSSGGAEKKSEEIAEASEEPADKE